MRTVSIRSEVQRLLSQRPFRPFALLLENGDRAISEHPENIAFDPVAEGGGDCYVFSGKLRLFSTFEAVTSVTLRDAGGEAASA